MDYNKFKKHSTLNNFKINNELKNKILYCLNKKLNIWNKVKKKNEVIKIKNRFKNKKLEDIFINRLELFLNNIGVSYLYWLNWKKLKTRKSYNQLIKNINDEFKKQFGKSKILDIKILIYIYNNIFDKIITKDTLNYCLNKLNAKKKMKGGLIPFIAAPLLGDKLFILHYLEENYTWAEWLMIFIDLALDIVGLIPPVGWAVDLVGIIISILRKDWLGAIMSLIGVIPVIGSFINTPYSVIVNALAIIRLLRGQ